MADSSKTNVADSQPSIAELQAQISSMQAGFTAYSQAVKHHSLTLSGLRKEIDDLKLCNTSKDTIISNQEKTIGEMQSEIKELKENLEGILSMKSALEQLLEREGNQHKQHNECQQAGQAVVSEQELVDARAAREQLTPAQKTALDKDLFDVAASPCVRDVQTLLRRGADVNSRHKDKKTPLMSAAENGTSEIAHILIAWGASVDARGECEWTALMRASRNGNLAVVEMLIAQGALINLRNKYQSTALTWAAAEGHVEVCEVLIAQGANIDAQVESGNNALILASANNHLKAVESLIRCGANLNLKNNNNKTALIWARENRHGDVVRQLEAAGAQG